MRPSRVARSLAAVVARGARAFVVVASCGFVSAAAPSSPSSPSSSSAAAAGDSDGAVGGVVELAALPPGCLEPFQRVLLLPTLVAEPLARRGGRFAVVASGPDALAAPDVVAFPDAGGGPVARLPAAWTPEDAVDVLETPFERIVVVEPLPDLDLLALVEQLARDSGGRFPDVVRRRLPRVRAPGVVGLQVGDALRADGDRAPGAERREIAARFVVELDGRRGTMVAVSRSLGGAARVHHSLVGEAASPPADRLVLHAGGARAGACAAALAGLGVAAAVPRTVDLVAAHEADAGAALPYVAANLVDDDGARPWPGHRLFTVAGLRVAVIGLVGSGEVARAPGPVRARWRARSGRDAVAAEIATLRRAPSGPPDLIVALSSGDGAERAQLAAVDGLDVVVGDFARDDGLPVRMTLVPAAVDGGRERSRHDALVAPVFHRAGLGRVVARFGPSSSSSSSSSSPSSSSSSSGPVPRPLLGVDLVVDPLLDDGGGGRAAAAFAAPLRRDEDERAARGAAVLLPAVAELVAAAPALASPLVWGERVAVLGEERRRLPGDAAIWTDDLWLRVVGNAVARGAGVDVALLRNMRRAPLVAGPLSRATLEAWLDELDDVALLELSGIDLLRLADRLAAAPAALDDASGLIATSGLDPVRRLVAGRPVEPLARYRLAVDERLRGDPRLQGLLEGGSAAAPAARVADVLALVVDGLAAAVPADAPLPARAATLLADRARTRTTEWRVGVQGLDVRGQVVRTSENLPSLAPSLEARALQRDLLLVSARLQAFALLDADGFAWDNQLRLQYDATFFSAGGPGPPVIEPFDDVVATTELRADLLRLSWPGDAPLLAFFVNATADGELTPAPGLRRQAQLRQATGLSFTLTGLLRELRLGVVAQQDAAALVDATAAGAGVFLDAGLLGLLRVGALLPGGLMLDVVNDARFFLGDDDDRPFDLALRAQSVTRLTAPLSPNLGGFVFVDVVALTPKPSPIAVEWNVVAGAGLTFGSVLRW
jgi:hypothetical protein